MVKINWNWIAGFFDGEGSIRIQVEKRKNLNLGYRFREEIVFTQGGKRGKELLERIKSFLKEQNIDSFLRETNRESKYMKCYELRVSHKKRVKKFIQQIKKHLFLKRQEAKITLKIIEKIENKEHLEKEGFINIMEMKDRMDKNKGGKRGKYNTGYFEEMWDL